MVRDFFKEHRFNCACCVGNPFDIKFSLIDVVSERARMIKSGRIKIIKTSYGTLDIIKHPLLEKHVRPL